MLYLGIFVATIAVVVAVVVKKVWNQED